MTQILDVACGSRMFYFNKKDERVLFCDNREESHILCDGRKLEIKPDVVSDFTDLKFADESFSMVVFDPPHLKNVGDKAWIGLKYGKLPKDFIPYLQKGFSECFRVLKPNGTLIFKWNEDQILVSEILKCTNEKPVFGHKSGKNSKTHWIVFIKGESNDQN